MVSMDLRDVYFHVQIHVAFQKYLRFCLDDFHFQFVCLPFGLSTSPRTFIKLLVVVIAVLRINGILIYHYLEDILVLARSRQQLLAHRNVFMCTLQEFAWLINQEKSVLCPSQCLTCHLQADIDTAQATVSLPHEKVFKDAARSVEAWDALALSAETCMKVVGTMMSTTPILSWAETNLKALMATYMPGILNIQADYLSRHRLDKECSLLPQVFHSLVEQTF